MNDFLAEQVANSVDEENQASASVDEMDEKRINAILARQIKRRRISINEAPEFTRRLSSYTDSKAGETVTLSGRFRAWPRPSITWFRDDNVIGETLRHTFDTSTDGDETVESLIIKEVDSTDEGAYRCRIENSEGSASTTGYLSVTADKSAKTGSDRSRSRSSSNLGFNGSTRRRSGRSCPPSSLRPIVEQKSIEEKEEEECLQLGPSPIQEFIDVVRLKRRGFTKQTRPLVFCPQNFYSDYDDFEQTGNTDSNTEANSLQQIISNSFSESNNSVTRFSSDEVVGETKTLHHKELTTLKNTNLNTGTVGPAGKQVEIEATDLSNNRSGTAKTDKHAFGVSSLDSVQLQTNFVSVNQTNSFPVESLNTISRINSEVTNSLSCPNSEKFVSKNTTNSTVNSLNELDYNRSVSRESDSDYVSDSSPSSDVRVSNTLVCNTEQSAIGNSSLNNNVTLNSKLVNEASEKFLFNVSILNQTNNEKAITEIRGPDETMDTRLTDTTEDKQVTTMLGKDPKRFSQSALEIKTALNFTSEYFLPFAPVVSFNATNENLPASTNRFSRISVASRSTQRNCTKNQRSRSLDIKIRTGIKVSKCEDTNYSGSNSSTITNMPVNSSVLTPSSDSTNCNNKEACSENFTKSSKDGEKVNPELCNKDKKHNESECTCGDPQKQLAACQYILQTGTKKENDVSSSVTCRKKPVCFYVEDVSLKRPLEKCTDELSDSKKNLITGITTLIHSNDSTEKRSSPAKLKDIAKLHVLNCHTDAIEDGLNLRVHSPCEERATQTLSNCDRILKCISVDERLDRGSDKSILTNVQQYICDLGSIRSVMTSNSENSANYCVHETDLPDYRHSVNEPKTENNNRNLNKELITRLFQDLGKARIQFYILFISFVTALAAASLSVGASTMLTLCSPFLLITGGVIIVLIIEAFRFANSLLLLQRLQAIYIMYRHNQVES